MMIPDSGLLFLVTLYIAPQAATAAEAALLFHRQSGPAATGLWPATKQPYAALVCRLMVSTP